jgi:hypothetical protein
MEMPRQNPCGLSIYIFLNEGQEGKAGLFQYSWIAMVGGKA